ncbi:GNAT family N-acetyltransferase [Micromonospora polyrhachis]|uniref:RimJ/RimL family protein N-acetyltransferase n=1 Tax=Micromonospora polyrhachis TaxID=1282883 RepID=A0A7W7SQX2_9ACTN|nr:GNAT family protein [Micromonospora polyrhachis]MBB4959181.1 RimJ/RimL family protein N-acetyltransferase [Micromonospora polyrhachis]
MSISTHIKISLAEKPTLTGELVLLRPVEAADVPGLVELVSDPEVGRLTGSHASFNIEALEQWYATRADHDDRLDLAIVERATGGYVGEVVLNEFDVDNLSCSLRIALVGTRAFGRGFGSEAIRLILGHAFETVGLHRVSLEVYDFNPRARHVYEKIGFVHEGTRRQALRWEDAWVDAHDMAILAHEWAKHQGHPDRCG